MITAKGICLSYPGFSVAPPATTDAELAVKCRKGDTEAFEILYKKYSKSLFNYIYRMVGDHDRARDLYQDTFIRVLTAKNYQPRAKFSTWLYRIATNLCINDLKRKKPVSLDAKLKMGAGFEARTISPEDYANSQELAEKIKTALEGLTDIQRAVFTLRHYQGLSYQEIARVLRCPLGTVKSRLSSAVNALRKVLSGELKEVFTNEMQ
ncbi:sigma-70 family RNA polymerase sigma factor [candidate division TA06 bacterium]|uniref:Sigma-70 family RNA polymerase sigma factor n=1 Tax=candidate division TA06 bacterium TaxID=2250710 RepID=A0A523UTY8_UNCT6|nr:MAG: sigma-70 family RNA polymerase sigma factor [candidate division TA06 bacterium]